MFFLDTYIYIKKVTLKEIKTMKNILAENLLRFGVKNLNEKDKVVLSEALLLEQIQLVDAAIKALNDEAAKYKIRFNRSLIHPAVSIGYTPKPLKAGDNFQQGKGGVERGYDTAAKGDVDLRTYSSSSPGGLPAGEENNNIYKIDATNKVTTPPTNLRTTYVESGTKDPNFNAVLAYKTGVFGLYANPFTDYGQTADGLKTAIKNYFGNFYTSKPIMGGVKGADFTTPLQDTTKFNGLIDTLVNALAGIQIMVKNTGSEGQGRVSAVTIFRS